MKQLYISLIVIILIIFSCKKDQAGQTQNSISVDTFGNELLEIPSNESWLWADTADKSILLTIPEKINWPHKGFIEISEEEYESQVAIKQIPAKIDSSQVNFTDSTFTIQTSKSRFTFDYSKKTEFANELVNYLGYIEGINMYVMTKWIEGEIYTGDMMIIDSVSNYLYRAMSASDGATEFPLISKNGEFILFYSNAYHYSGLIVAKRYLICEKDQYVQLMGAYINGLIAGIRWTKDDFLFIKINEKRRENNFQDDISFFKTTAPIGNIGWDVP